MKEKALWPMSYTGKIKDALLNLGEVVFLFFQTVFASVSRPFYFGRFLDQMIIIGIGSLPITLLVGLVTGLIMTLQFGFGLAKFGGTLYVPSLVSLSLIREISPVFTALLVGGRIAAGMSAEIGSMSVTQQVEALRALGTSPIRILVVPRFLATALSLPLLTILSLLIGQVGGLLIAMNEFEMTSEYYFDKAYKFIEFPDFFNAIFKALVFAVLITIVACHLGLKTRGGTQGVGNATKAVIVSTSLLILVADFFISKIFLTFWGDTF